MPDTNPIVMSELTDPVELARSRAQNERADRNSAWLQAHVPEIYANYRGKCICVAGEELFVADTVAEVMALAKAAHPEDDGAILRYILKEKREMIYAAGRALASL
jgi:hypothetical protein